MAWAVAPMVAAVGLFGVSFGVLAVAAGFPAWQAVLMSATVFAGSAQFAAVGVVASGGGAAAAVLAGVLLNSRYLPMAAVAARTLPRGRLRRFLAAQLVTDESFSLGVAAGSPERPDGRAVVVAGLALWAAWVVGTLLGALGGSLLGDPARLGLDAAFPAMFVALLWPMLGRSDARRAAAAGAVVALVLTPFVPAGVPLAVAAVVGLALSR